MSRETVRVLYAEDDPRDADLTRSYLALNAPHIELKVVNTGEQCLANLKQSSPDVLLLDNHLPDMDGLDVLKELAAREAFLPVILVTGLGDEALVVQVLRLGAWDYLPK